MKNKSAVELGKLGGIAKSLKKANSSRRNGKLGGNKLIPNMPPIENLSKLKDQKRKMIIKEEKIMTHRQYLEGRIHKLNNQLKSANNKIHEVRERVACLNGHLSRLEYIFPANVAGK